LDQLKSSRWTVNSLQPRPRKARAGDAMPRIVGEGPDSVKLRPDMRCWFRESGVDLMIYPVPDPLSFEAGVPYVMAIHDLQHRLQPDFPEVSADGEWESREYLFRNGSRYATLLLADSQTGKEDILTFYEPYGVTADRVKILPFAPTSYLAVEVGAS